MSLDGSSMTDELSFSMVGMVLDASGSYEVMVLDAGGNCACRFESRWDMNWEQWLPTIAAKCYQRCSNRDHGSYCQTITLLHNDGRGNMKVLPLDEPVGVVGVVGEWVTGFGQGIVITATVNELQSWYNEFLMRTTFDAWVESMIYNPWRELS